MLNTDKSHSKDNKNLNEWLCYLETIHASEIELGLSRIGQVAKRLQIDLSFACVITVAGTNGKGTTCAFLENALFGETINHPAINQSINKVAVYSSPHITRFNERLRINKRDVEDQLFISAFEKIEQARGEISLSYYEYTTLAAFLVLMHEKPQVIILEVGLGGRLDATNIIDADVAVITSIDLDHQAFLGNNREVIGFEKAGIMRADQHIIIGDPDVPHSVLAHAHKINQTFFTAAQAIPSQSSPSQKIPNSDHFQRALAKIKVRNKDFFIAEQTPIEKQSLSWQWQYNKKAELSEHCEISLNHLLMPHIPQDNVATAIMVLHQLGVNLTTDKLNGLIEQTQVAGRTELFLKDKPINLSLEHSNQQTELETLTCDVMLDVGHNPHAGRYLVKKLTQCKQQHSYQRIIAVVAMLADKDIENTLAPFHHIIDQWFSAPLTVPRAASSQQMKSALSVFTNSINCFDNITQAFKMANQKAESTDLILVFGSFFTVAQVRQLLI